MNEPVENVLIVALVACVLCVVAGSALLVLTFVVHVDLFFNRFGTIAMFSVYPIPVLLTALTWMQGWRSIKILAATAVCLLPGYPVVHTSMCGIGLTSCAFP